jgi:hypothetical protein
MIVKLPLATCLLCFRIGRYRLHSYGSKPLLVLQKSKELLCLDFDGVICASSGESSFSALFAAAMFWPHIFSSLTLSLKAEESPDPLFLYLQRSIERVRPIIETGYENLLIARYFYESLDVSNRCNQAIAYIEQNWTPSFRDSLIIQYGSTKVRPVSHQRQSLTLVTGSVD